jgi:iron(III) transport system substrate-binding protein
MIFKQEAAVGLRSVRRQVALVRLVAAAILLAWPWCVAAAGEADGWKPQWQKTVEAAKKEGQLVIYGSADYEKLFWEFHKKYPEIAVKGFFGRGADVAKRIMAERRAEKYLADLYLNGMTTGYNVLYKAKAVDPIAPALLLPEVSDPSKWWQGKHQYVDPENRYLFNFNGESRIVLAYNKNLVNPDEVRSYWDILKPKWKGKIVGLDPMSGGSGDALRFFYHNRLLGPEFLKRLLTEMDMTISGDSRQMGDWLAAGKFAITIFGPVSRMDLDLAKEQGLPVDWFEPAHLKEGAYITAGSGGVALMNRAPHPHAATVAINWLLSREGQIAYQKLFVSGEDGPDSMRIDIPKDGVPKRNLRPTGDATKYPLMDRADMMDMEPIRKFVRETMEQRKR